MSEFIATTSIENQELLNSGNELHASALLGIRDGIIVTDCSGLVSLMNRMAENLTGTSNLVSIGKRIEDVCTIVNEATLLPAGNPVWEALREDRGSVCRDLILLSATGDEYHIEAGAEPVRDKRGEIIGAVLTFRDITEDILNVKRLKEERLKTEEMHNKIQSSIMYTRHIQDAIMPPKSLLSNNFNDSFILYKPKDIISGDFYWFAEAGDKFVVAVADCTGHGVPGAFLSAIGCSSLNEIVNNKRITQPAQILKELDLCLRQVLKPDVNGYHGQDGMEIAICSFDKRSGRLEYAGANRPLFCMSDGLLSIINGDKYGVGGAWEEATKSFTNHVVPFCKGDMIYLFSDGYSDQFGGKDEKKMMKRNFIKLLDAIVSYGIEEQAEMLGQWLERWKGKLEQTDDILLVGIKL